MPEAMVVRVAAEKRLAGASIEEAAAAAEAAAKRSTALFMVDDLEYLKRGGRVSATAAFFGGMLDIKPVLYISPSGKLEPLLKIKGNKKAMRTMQSCGAKCAADPQESHMVICQADCEEQAEVFEGMIREKVAPKSLHTQAVGPVIGSHCGLAPWPFVSLPIATTWPIWSDLCLLWAGPRQMQKPPLPLCK